MEEHKSCGQGVARTLPQQAVEAKKTRGTAACTLLQEVVETAGKVDWQGAPSKAISAETREEKHASVFEKTRPIRWVEDLARSRNNSSSSSGNDGGSTEKPQVPEGGVSSSGVVAGGTPHEPVDRGKTNSDGTDRAVDRNTQLIYHWDRDPVVAQGRTRAEKQRLRDGIG